MKDKLIALIKAYAYITFVRWDCRVLTVRNAHGIVLVAVVDDEMDFKKIYYNDGRACCFRYK